jgi:2,3-bisphosphoglycerate-dependent phosphoglycerate mutase
MIRYVFALSVLFFSCKTTSLYVVRHAEKEASATADMMTTDAPLSAAGAERALALRDQLKDAGIGAIYSTATNRTTATARPLSAATGVAIQLYDAQNPLFIKQLVRHRGAPVLVVGHSNTVDDIVNTLTGKNLLQDLPETQYGDLFIVRLKGKKAELEQSRYGK